MYVSTAGAPVGLGTTLLTSRMLSARARLRLGRFSASVRVLGDGAYRRQDLFPLRDGRLRWLDDKHRGMRQLQELVSRAADKYGGDVRQAPRPHDNEVRALR